MGKPNEMNTVGSSAMKRIDILEDKLDEAFAMQGKVDFIFNMDLDVCAILCTWFLTQVLPTLRTLNSKLFFFGFRSTGAL